MRLALAIAFGFVSLGVMGCAHVDRERAEYHEDKARRAANHGDYHKAAREERKADHLEHRAETDPLP